MSARVYNLLMAVFLPGEVRHRYGADMRDLFQSQLGRSSSVRGWLGLWAAGAWDLARHGSAQRIEPPAVGPRRGGSGPVRGWLSALARDVRFAWRVLRTSPLFTTVAVVTLALGIGANTAMYSIIDAVLLQPLPYPESQQLVVVKSFDIQAGRVGTVTTPANFADQRDRAQAFVAMAALSGDVVALQHDGETRRLLGVRSAGSLLQVLGTPPLFGRLLTAADDLRNEPVVVVSHALWQSTYGDDRAILGATLNFDGTPHTVVGVMPPDFDFPYFRGAAADFYGVSGWSDEYRANTTNFAHRVIGRLAPAATLAQAQDEMDAIATQLREERPAANQNYGVRLVAAHDDQIADARGPLRLLMGAVGLVLLIAAVNLANLLMARAAAREQEIAVRKALGATQGQLARQVLTESLVLGWIGGIAGVAVAYLGLGLMARLIPWDIPNLDAVRIDGGALVFALVASTLTGVAFGVLPALRLAGGNVARRLVATGRGSAETSWTWTGLVVTEVALAVVLLVAAGLLLRTMVNLTNVDPGFRADDVVTFTVAMPDGQAPGDRLIVWDQLEAEYAVLPGVLSAARASQMPAESNRVSGWFNFVDRPVDNSDRSFLVPYRLVSDAYFDTLGIAVVAGRSLRGNDESQPAEVVINESARARFWGERDPLGDVVGIGNREGELFLPAAAVVGVVADVHNDGIGAEPRPAFYFSALHARDWSNLTFALHVTPGTDVLAAARARTRDIEPMALMYQEGSIAAMLSAQIAPTRSLLGLLGSFAAVGLAMAGIGVFGLLSFAVSRRTREIGIRIALGADSRSLAWTVVAQALGKVLVGAAIGVPAAIVVGRWLESLLFGVGSADVLTLLAVVALLVLVALLASYLPARRAASADPTVALRST